MTDVDDAVVIYRALEGAIRWAIMAGMNSPNPAFVQLRKKAKDEARRAKRKVNIAARERREKMRPLVQEAAKDFHGIHNFSSLATAVYKILQNQSEFVTLVEEANHQSRSIDKAKGLIQKGLLPRQIKEDIEVILLELDEEAALESELLEWDRDCEKIRDAIAICARGRVVP